MWCVTLCVVYVYVVCVVCMCGEVCERKKVRHRGDPVQWLHCYPQSVHTGPSRIYIQVKQKRSGTEEILCSGYIATHSVFTQAPAEYIYK